MDDLFVAQSERPAHLRNLALDSLTPSQRGLLVIPGFASQFIEACSMEEVEVVCLNQTPVTLDRPDSWLEAAPGAELIRRVVYLEGRSSARISAVGESVIFRLLHDGRPLMALNERFPLGGLR
jgi:chorismate-pyruvate lyase